MTHQYTKLADALDFVCRAHVSDDYPSDQEPLAEAASILRAAASVDVAGLIELAAKAIYDQWADQRGWVEWVPGGNSLNQDEARQIARAALESALRMALAGHPAIHQPAEFIKIGRFTVDPSAPGVVWLRLPEGEGMGCDPAKLEAVLAEFYDRNF